MPPDVAVRQAGMADADTIADLHAESWRATYRGTLSDAYLDGPVADERRSFWRERLGQPTPGLVTLLAERGGATVGFACALTGADGLWGTLVDNLHARPDLKRQGLGRLLMRRLGEELAAAGAAGAVHLFVLKANRAAAAFYARIGGRVAEELRHTEPDGSQPLVERIVWADVGALLRGCEDDR